MNPHEQLLQAIAARQQKSATFNTGILTADRYVRTVLECVGSDACYKFAATRVASFEDVLRKSAKTLTYNAPDEDLLDLYGKPDEWKGDKLFTYKDKDGDELELPKNTLMVFKHTLTTPRKDRDGDVMRTQGAKPDPKMLLLWQHVHTLPIGKMLQVIEHNSKKLAMVSVIVDMNDLCHDAAVMIDNKMGRFSHGFRALEFEEIKEGGGFDVKLFEIMEESLVSVPSNVDAEVEEIILSLTEGGKLTSPMMKEVGKSVRIRRDKRVSVGTDVSALPAKTGEEHGTAKTKCNGDAGCSCGCEGKPAGTPEKTDDGSDGKTPAADGKEMMVCPKCGGEMANGKCLKCDYQVDKAGTPTAVKGGVPQPYVYPGQIEDSYESVSWSLRSQASEFLEKAGLVSQSADEFGRADYYYTDVVATFSDHAIICVEDKDGRRYYSVSWKKDSGNAIFVGVPKEVQIQTTTTILEKAFRQAKSTRFKNCGTGAGGFQPGNTCARGGTGDEAGGGNAQTNSIIQGISTALAHMNHAYEALVNNAEGAMQDTINAFLDPFKVEKPTEKQIAGMAQLIVAYGTPEQRHNLKQAISALEAVSEMKSDTEQLKSLL